MYLKELKTALTLAMTKTFDADYPEVDFQSLHASIEYPAKAQNYPGVWVDFDPAGPLRTAGIDHYEYVDAVDPDTGQSGSQKLRRWRFQGLASYTVVALTSLERDRLFDEVVRVFAFGEDEPGRNAFREYVENNPYIATNADFDEIEQGGFATTPGTPWGTDEIIYEATIRLELIGEFLSDPTDATVLVPLSAVRLVPYEEGTPDPLPEGDGEGQWM